MGAGIGAQSSAAHRVTRAAANFAAFIALSILSVAAHAQSCSPAEPRRDSGAGFTPFGEREQALGRAGKRGRAWEWALGTDTRTHQKVQASLDWASGQVYSWRLVNSGAGSEMLEIRDAGRLRLRLAYPSGMDAGNALELRVQTHPSVGAKTSIEASLTSLNGHSVLGALSQPGTRARSEQALYYYFPQMAQGFAAEGTVSLTYPRKPRSVSRVQFTVRAGTIPCSSAGNAPTVSITDPAAGSAFSAPATVTVTADASDSDGTVARVAFFANGTPIGTDTESPFAIDWTNVQTGAYSLTAVAIDNEGLQTASGAVPITIGAARALYFIHVDHLNTPRLIADSMQKTVWRWDQQEPFGNNPVSEDPDVDSIAFSFPQRFPGQYYDAETLLHYNYFRDYDASLGRYVQSDPIGLVGGLNTYGYVGGMPISFADPTGEIFFVPVVLAGILAGGSAATTTTMTVVTVSAIGATVGAITGAVQAGQSLGWCTETAPQIVASAAAGFAIGGVSGIVTAPLGFGGVLLAGGIAGFSGSLAGSVIGGQSVNVQTLQNAGLMGTLGMLSGFAAIPAFAPLVVSSSAVAAAVLSGSAQLGMNSIVATNSGGFGFANVIK